MNELRPLLPYLRPYRREYLLGMALVVWLDRLVTPQIQRLYRIEPKTRPSFTLLLASLTPALPLIGLGGWMGRNEKSGPYIRFKDGRFVKEQTPGAAGHHGKQHEFKVINRDMSHPITKGLPQIWMHAKDELYDRLRGPAENMTVLATAFSDPETGGSGENEPILMVLQYGRGRVFHTVLGDNPEAMKCVGFIVTLQRGTEWAATGKVSQKVPADFPTAEHISIRQ
jgi:type 1 glutamine amidotransferase